MKSSVHPGSPKRARYSLSLTGLSSAYFASCDPNSTMPSRAIFDRYNIINEQELLEAGNQLVAYLAQHAQATPRGGRPHPARTAAQHTAPPLRLVRRTTA